MSKKKLPIGKIQTFGIVFLSLSAVFLLLQTPLFGGIFEQSSTSDSTAEQTYFDNGNAYFTPFPLPVKMAYCNGSAHCAYTTLTTESDAFKALSSTLGEAVNSAEQEEKISREDFLDALSQSSIYFDFSGDLPSGLITDLLGASAEYLPETVHRLLLLPGREASVSLLVQSGDAFLRYKTAAQSTAVSEVLSAIADNGVEFAEFLGKEYASLSPFTLLGETSPVSTQLSASVALPEEEEILRLIGMNPHTESRYTDSNGTRVVREGNVQLSVQTDGTVTYTEDIDDGSASLVLQSGASLTLKDTVCEIEQLADTMLGSRLGDAALYVSSVREQDGVISVAIDAQLDGVPIHLFSGKHTVYAEIEGNAVRMFYAVFRSYTRSDANAVLLPAKQAAAIVPADADTELSVVYIDTGAEAVNPGWIPVD